MMTIEGMPSEPKMPAPAIEEPCESARDGRDLIAIGKSRSDRWKAPITFRALFFPPVTPDALVRQPKEIGQLADLVRVASRQRD